MFRIFDEMTLIPDHGDVENFGKFAINTDLILRVQEPCEIETNQFTDIYMVNGDRYALKMSLSDVLKILCGAKL